MFERNWVGCLSLLLAICARAEEPSIVFSVVGGVYTNTVVVALSCPLPQAAIRYTLNNTVPTPDSPTYAAPIPVPGCLTIRARAFPPGAAAGPLHTESYIVLDASLARFTSPLPLFVINTDRRAVPPPASARVPATVTVVSPGGTAGRAGLLDSPDYHGRASIGKRGHYSAEWPKPTYNVELLGEEKDRSAALAGLPPGSDWVLFSFAHDPSQLCDVLSHELYERMGHYAVRRRYVEVFVRSARTESDGDSPGRLKSSDYQGVYLLLERIRIGKHRVRLARLEAQDNAEPEITGGYIFKRDKLSPRDEHFPTPSGQELIVHAPKRTALRQPQRDWLRRYVADFENALYGPNWLDPDAGYARYVDMDSFVDYHWLVEFTAQWDGHRYSTYFVKDRGAKIAYGPIWDCHWSFVNWGDYRGWVWPTRTQEEHIWQRRLLQAPGDPDYQQRIVDRWSVLRTNAFDPALLAARIDTLAAQLEEPWQRERTRWCPHGCGQAPQTVAALKRWIAGRHRWLDQQFTPVPEVRVNRDGPNAKNVLELNAPQGTIYYTLDGSDPRLWGGPLAHRGAISPRAIPYQRPIEPPPTGPFCARALSNGAWSAPLRTVFAQPR